MRIVITGGYGYIGYNLAKYLFHCGHEVTVVSRSFDNKTQERLPANINHLELDITKTNPDIYCSVGEPDILIHLAWTDGFNHNSISHVENVNGHIDFIRNMIDGGLKHLVANGSMHEIGCFNGEVCKNTPTNPMNLYGIAKDFFRRSIEILCRQHDVIFQWLRVFYIYGDDKNNNSIFTKILKTSDNGVKNFSLNSGELLYDFIHIDDLVEQMEAVLLQKEITGIINCCTGSPVSLKTMVNQFVQDNKLPIQIEYGKYPLRPYDAKAIWGDPKTIQSIMVK